MNAAQPHQAQDKLAFLLSLVPYLMDHESVSVSIAAAHFGVTEDLIRQSVRLIAVSGIPGETSHYQPDDLFDIDWDAFEIRDEIAITHPVAIDESPRFSAREAAALIAGLQYLSALPEQAERDVVGSLMTKLTRGASAAPSEVAVGRAGTDLTLATIRDAVSAGMQVEFVYLNSRGERESRRVDPLRIESLDEHWYLRGWCHLRRAVRTFRLDRVSQLKATNDAITHKAADVTLPETLFQTSDNDVTVTVDAAPGALPLIAEYVSAQGPHPRSRKLIRATLRLAHLGTIARLAGGLPGLVTVVEPDEARDIVARWAGEALNRYTDGTEAESGTE